MALTWHYRLAQPGPLDWWQLDENTNNYEISYNSLVAVSATVAASANFKGNWSALTGALAVPASVYHNSSYWMLLESVANVTAEQPGVSNKWAKISNGDVVGPASSTNNAIAMFDGVTGKIIKGGVATLSDNGQIISLIPAAGEVLAARFGSSLSGDSAYLDIISNNTANEIVYDSTGHNSGAHVWRAGGIELARLTSAGTFLTGANSAGGMAYAQVIRNISSAANTETGLFFSPASTTDNSRGAIISGKNDGSNNVDLCFYTGLGPSITEKMRIGAGGGLGLGAVPSATVKLNIAGGLAVIGAANFGAVAIPGSIDNVSPVTRCYVGDGSGYSWRFSKRSGSVTTDLFGITDNTNAVLSLLGPLGYGAGAGGVVTQSTSKSTAVTLNKPCGRITTHNAALAAGASVQFTLNNSTIGDTDTLNVNAATNGNYTILCINCSGGGSALIRITNNTAGSLSEAIPINFAVLKGVTS